MVRPHSSQACVQLHLIDGVYSIERIRKSPNLLIPAVLLKGLLFNEDETTAFSFAAYLDALAVIILFAHFHHRLPVAVSNNNMEWQKQGKGDRYLSNALLHTGHLPVWRLGRMSYRAHRDSIGFQGQC
jgi:hypothetical protein